MEENEHGMLLTVKRDENGELFASLKKFDGKEADKDANFIISMFYNMTNFFLRDAKAFGEFYMQHQEEIEKDEEKEGDVKSE